MLVDTVTPRRSGPSRALVLGIAAIAAAVAGGWWLGGVSQTPEPVASPTAVVTVGTVQAALAPEWSPAPAAPGPDAEGGRAFAPSAGLPARALLVSGPAVDASLVPGPLLSALGTDLPAPRRTNLAGLSAWTYGPVRGEERVFQVTVVPTTTGSLAVTCSSPPETWSVALGCASGVREVSAVDGRALAPAPDLAFRQNAPAVLASLDDARVAGRKALAGPAAGRAAAAVRLARAHRSAAAALAPFAVEGPTAGAVGALRAVGARYEAFAAAVRSGSRPRFVRVRGGLRRAEAALAAALR